MATILRTWSYQYPWLYASISQLTTLAVGGESRFHQLPLENLSLTTNGKILDLCCGGGQAIPYLLQYSSDVTGLDASAIALARAKKNVPQAKYIQARAEALPFEDNSFDWIHTSVALHEMTPTQRQQILTESYRVLKPAGIFALIDFHRPKNFLFLPPLALFLGLFETETAWEWINCDILAELSAIGFMACHQQLYVGGSLQVVQAKK